MAVENGNLMAKKGDGRLVGGGNGMFNCKWIDGSLNLMMSAL